MSQGICARCKKKHACKYMQPEGWVLECEEFEEDADAVSTETPANEDRSDFQREAKKD